MVHPPTEDHEHSEAVRLAAIWYAANRANCERPVIPALRRRFPLSAKEACEVLFLANAGGADASTS